VAGVVFGAPFELTCSRQRLVAGKTFTLLPATSCASAPRRAACGLTCACAAAFRRAILGSRSPGTGAGGGSSAVSARAIRTHFLPEGFLLQTSNRSPAAAYSLLALQAEGPSRRQLEVLPGLQAFLVSRRRFLRAIFHGDARRQSHGTASGGDAPATAGSRTGFRTGLSGAVQVTRDGQCIILGVDGQTIAVIPRSPR